MGDSAHPKTKKICAPFTCHGDNIIRLLPRFQVLVLLNEIGQRDGDMEFVRVWLRAFQLLASNGLAAQLEVLLLEVRVVMREGTRGHA